MFIIKTITNQWLGQFHNHISGKKIWICQVSKTSNGNFSVVLHCIYHMSNSSSISPADTATELHIVFANNCLARVT